MLVETDPAPSIPAGVRRALRQTGGMQSPPFGPGFISLLQPLNFPEDNSLLSPWGAATDTEETMKTMNDLFLHILKDIYYAEKQILKALPKMVKAAETPELKQALEDHREETEGQVERLEQVFNEIDKPARGEKCEAIMGIISEGEDIIKKGGDPDVIDAGLIASAQAVEHYEIARYGTLIAWAEQLGLSDSPALLRETLQEEKAADKKLTELAEANVNRKAA
jgi:ferritin-like metal-binding protein YciE